MRMQVCLSAHILPRAAVLFAISLLVFPCAIVLAQGETPKQTVPVITELSKVEISGTAQLLAAVVDLQANNYVENEFFASGQANRYRITEAFGNASIVDGSWPWTTRIFIRRPANAEDFNGTVVLEWPNVTTGQDIDFIWHALADQLMEDGAAYVAVSAQRVGIRHLRQWSPQRYGSLNLSTSDPATDAELEPGGGVFAGGDTLAWDILSQVAKTLRSSGTDDLLLPGFEVKHIIAAGESQSAGRLTRYYNHIHPMHQVMDAFLFYDAAGPLRSDMSSPAVSIESEWMHDNDPTAYKPDTPFLRRWPVAGGSHVSYGEILGIDEMILRDASMKDLQGNPVTLTDVVASGGCQFNPVWSAVPNDVLLRAAYVALVTWLETGRSAPAATPFHVSSGQLDRDTQGQIIGGVRLPHFEAPMAENRGVNAGGGFCSLAGHHRFYSSEEMVQRYGSIDNYLNQVTASVLRNVFAGFVLPRDGEAILNSAKQAMP